MHILHFLDKLFESVKRPTHPVIVLLGVIGAGVDQDYVWLHACRGIKIVENLVHAMSRVSFVITVEHPTCIRPTKPSQFKELYARITTLGDLLAPHHVDFVAILPQSISHCLAKAISLRTIGAKTSDDRSAKWQYA
jgi:hypothetical protein